MYDFFKILAIVGLAAIANSAAVTRNNNVLQVNLTPGDNAVVHATVKNVGAEALNLLSYGTLFDSAPVQKVKVYEGETAVPFIGIFRSIHYTDLTPEAFYTLKAGQTFETTFDAAKVYDLSNSTYTFVAEGAISIASVGSTELAGAIIFKSNALIMTVDGEAAKSVVKAFPTSNDRRTVPQSDCTGAIGDATRQALYNCSNIARIAWTNAYAGSRPHFAEYFNDSSVETRDIVAARFIGVQNECLVPGNTTVHCTDVYNQCTANVLAYTLPSLNTVVNCPLYYSALPAITTMCPGEDRATVMIRELTRAPGTYNPGTLDYAYGFAASTALTTAQAILNADSYALYAIGIYNGC